MYNITALLTAAFASSAASPAAAQDTGFDYSTRLLPSGAIAIDGRRLADDGAFDVRFWVSAAAHRRLAARLAGNPAARLAA